MAATPPNPDVCRAESPAGVRCERRTGHDGWHGAWLRWSEKPAGGPAPTWPGPGPAPRTWSDYYGDDTPPHLRDDDETPTVQFPPIGSTTRRRPPVPPARVVELTDRVELLQALGRELQRELAELRDVDEDQADAGRDS